MMPWGGGLNRPCAIDKCEDEATFVMFHARDSVDVPLCTDHFVRAGSFGPPVAQRTLDAIAETDRLGKS